MMQKIQVLETEKITNANLPVKSHSVGKSALVVCLRTADLAFRHRVKGQ